MYINENKIKMGEPDECTTLYMILSETRSLPRREYQFWFQLHSPSPPLRAYSLLIRRPLGFHILCFENKSRSNRFFHPSEICMILCFLFLFPSAARPLTHSTVRYASHEQVNVVKRTYIIYYCYVTLSWVRTYIIISFLC